jgi:hypothetical protein
MTATERHHVRHVPVVGPPPKDGETHGHLVIDCADGHLIGKSPNVQVEQTAYRKGKDGVITITLKFTPRKDS